MIVLDTTAKALQVVLAAAVATSQLECQASWRDITASAYTAGESSALTNGTTDVTLVAAPAASTQRVIDYIAVYNADTAPATVTVETDTSTVERRHVRVTLRPGESLHYDGQGGAWRTLDARGAMLTAAQTVAPASAVAIPFLKVGTAAEAIGSWYSFAKDTGMPGAWAPGTPGINGRATNGTAAPDDGCLRVPNAPGGSINLLTGLDGTANVVGTIDLVDLLWVNSGIVVTTTTLQAITPVAIPARDLDGSANGRGVMAGILVTAATTNAGAIANTTITYTNSAGVGSRTATMASFPATAVIGTVVWFQLAAGDEGVRSVEGITLGTSYAGGSISLILATQLMGRGDPAINVGPLKQAPNQDHGVRLYDGACILPFGVASATTARTIFGRAYVATRAA